MGVVGGGKVLSSPINVVANEINASVLFNSERNDFPFTRYENMTDSFSHPSTACSFFFIPLHLCVVELNYVFIFLPPHFKSIVNR